jgi:aminoacyl tRNA synthase complex-interacting multifunctional protein 1
MAGVDRFANVKKLVESFCSNPGKGDVGEGGIGDVCKAIATLELLGKSEEVQAEVADWIAFANKEQVDLNALSKHLETRSVLAGKGIEITVADLAVFAAIRESKSAEFEKFPHVLRWIDYIQRKQSVYPLIAVNAASFNPPKATPRPAAAPKAAAAPEAKAKKEKAPAVKKESDTSFSVLDIKVGVINKVWKHPGADALYVEEIDIGEATPRQIVSGLAKFLTEEQMLNRKVLVLTNVKAGKVRDVLSSGLVLCASNSDHTQCEPVVPPAEAKIGEKVTVAGFEGAPEEVLNPKKKQFEKIQPDLTTDGSGVACYQGIPFMLSGKPCTSSISNAIVK